MRVTVGILKQFLENIPNDAEIHVLEYYSIGYGNNARYIETEADDQWWINDNKLELNGIEYIEKTNCVYFGID